ncbi:hypothetical protein H4Q26_009594 [Puccinia striiformis f. sp. tritici PST-130]|nr:hypothetical protein H4Q26_009594 [Puccinia striiformis f. sp. tritici PST-130]
MASKTLRTPTKMQIADLLKQLCPSLLLVVQAIDFCLGATITNGAQLDAGSCNPTPMGSIPSKEHMPSVRIIGPSPDDVIPPTLLSMIFYVPANTYYLAPQQLNKNGLIKGHSHITIERVDGNRIFDTANPVFFKGVAGRAVNGQVKTSIKDGLPAGLYDAIYVRVGTGKKGGSASKSSGTSDNSSTGTKSKTGEKTKSKKHKNKKVCRVKKRKT